MCVYQDWGFWHNKQPRSILLVVLAINNMSPWYFSSDITNAFIGVLVFLPWQFCFFHKCVVLTWICFMYYYWAGWFSNFYFRFCYSHIRFNYGCMTAALKFYYGWYPSSTIAIRWPSWSSTTAMWQVLLLLYISILSNNLSLLLQ